MVKRCKKCNNPIKNIYCSGCKSSVSSVATLDQVFDYLVAYKKAHGGNTPTVHRAMADLGYKTTSVVATRFKQLERQGRIRRENNHTYITGERWILEG